jgi:hypothetical protein
VLSEVLIPFTNQQSPINTQQSINNQQSPINVLWRQPMTRSQQLGLLILLIAFALYVLVRVH